MSSDRPGCVGRRPYRAPSQFQATAARASSSQIGSKNFSRSSSRDAPVTTSQASSVIRLISSNFVNISQLVVEPWGHDADVTGAVLRRIRVADIRDSALYYLRFIGPDPVVVCSEGARPRRVYPDADQPRYAALIRDPSQQRRGRPGLPESHYRAVAVAYLELYESGVTHGILAELGRRFAAPHQTVRDWVARARSLGYLTPGKPGRSGATPGPRLYSLPE